ncbi:MAG: DMT family transporter [Candidatus Competibacteraceae bacterium]|nr:DMT family transporter [Candidatus Competibacteraceae bacterium]
MVMVAFATNSLLCREALASNAIGVADFTVARLVSGAVTLWLLVAITNGTRSIGGSWLSAAALFGYAACFSLAYTALSAGTGALLLFGAVQISMISWGVMRGEHFTPLKWLGVVSAFSGLVWFVAPGVEAPPLWDAMLMVAAGVCWGVYSLRGRGAKNPTVETAGNFVRSAPMVAILYLLPIHAVSATPAGWALAIASGALASGLGYALWYSVLPQLTAGTSATVQLSVPIIAAVGGVFFLGEPFSVRLAIASAVVLGGIFVFINSNCRA